MRQCAKPHARLCLPCSLHLYIGRLKAEPYYDGKHSSQIVIIFSLKLLLLALYTEDLVLGMSSEHINCGLHHVREPAA